MVRQDRVRFYNKVQYNIEYRRVDASKEEVGNAAKPASILESMLLFPDRYEIIAEMVFQITTGNQ